MVQFIWWKLLPDNQEAIKKLHCIFYNSSRHPTSPLRVKKELTSTWLRIPECRKVGDYVHTHTSFINYLLALNMLVQLGMWKA